MKVKQLNDGLFVKLHKYLGIYTLSLKEILYYPQKLQATVIIVPFRIFILLLIYSYAFNYVGKSINGINANIAIWSISIYHILLYTQFRGIFRTINDDIRRGNLETQLNKPYSYLVYKFWEHLGKGLPNFIISFCTVMPLLFYFTGGFPVNLLWTDYMGALCWIIGGTLVSAVVYIFIVLPALWIDDAQPFYWIVDKAILILGGAYIPLALLPVGFQTFANLTPFGAPMFATQMFNPGFSNNWFVLFSVQVVWIVLLLFAISFVFSKAQKRLSVNGG